MSLLVDLIVTKFCCSCVTGKKRSGEYAPKSLFGFADCLSHELKAVVLSG
ncbi:hypothetical protein KI809_03320 [Geobacter pelophilus]|uniref:Uncharacterized protein n=1 Tax=Geoanaerobacter pelophilus TaxID=60036 RepID=A0AAW4L678_9BACT|nr:hypothetical protein [Geoanaerobacter pelophilus]